jgi:ubiquitin carboxyl-terminal hydrolase 25/28
MAVSEYPGKTEHYRSCLEVIAFRPGYERLGLQRYLATGSAGA